ncbi:Endoglucanase 20 [Hibiscus syriacus]|uniref:cellulase n=1 Tax=Hibiscus syriacus TaxID=106335 RepID=A0A6A2WZU4_HIBSY|nr:Endoglucanase 20 [Hibiscus syriacus]
MGSGDIAWGLALCCTLAMALACSSHDELTLEDMNLSYDYKDALGKAILFFEGQRSGKLPASQRVNLVGGYYDAGDDVKFVWPMAFTVTLLSWAAIEYWHEISSADELNHLRTAIRWGIDFILRVHTSPATLYTQAQKRKLPTPFFAASLVFQGVDSNYSKKLLSKFKLLFKFADKYRGLYNESFPIYRSFSGCKGEFLWSAAWLYKASRDAKYINYAVKNQGWSESALEFSWDGKFPGALALLAPLRNCFSCCRVVITTIKWLQQLMLSVSPCSISTWYLSLKILASKLRLRHRLERLLTGSMPAPPETVVDQNGEVVANEAFEDFMAQESALASWLLSTISPQLLPQFIGAETAVAVWNKVTQFFVNRSTTTVMNLLYKLQSLKKGDDSMRNYLTRVKEVCDALESCGSPVAPVEQIIAFQCANVAQAVNRAASDSRFNQDLNRKSYTGGRSGGRGRGRPRVQCQLCGKVGHLVQQCWYRFDRDFLGDGSDTHRRKTSSGDINFVENTQYDDYGEGRTVELPQANAISSSRNHWVVDSGATHHVTPDATNIAQPSDYRGSGNIFVGNGASIPVESVGNTLISSQYQALLLSNILHVSKITKNLFSVSKLARDNRIFFEFHANDCCVRNEVTGSVLLRGKQNGGLYSFEMASDRSQFAGQASANVVATSEAPLNSLLAKEGIIHRVTYPHTSEQNRIVERKHRHLMELALVLLVQATLPLKFWCYPHLRAFQSQKLMFRSQECVFLGYSPQHKGYQCLAAARKQSPPLDIVVQPQHLHMHIPRDFACVHAPPMGTSVSTHSQNSYVHVVPNVVPTEDQFTSPSQVSMPTPTGYVSNEEASHKFQVPEHTAAESTMLLRSNTTINAHPMCTRSKAGVFKPKTFISSYDEVIPTTVHEAFQSEKWTAAIHDELNALQQNGTWNLVQLPEGRSAVGCKWLFKIKRNAAGNLQPCCSLLHNQYHIVLGSIKEMAASKALYGLRQAPRNWNDKLRASLIALGFRESKADNSLFVNNQTGSRTFILVYVDDIILTGESVSYIQRVIYELNKQFSLNDLGDLSYFLVGSLLYVFHTRPDVALSVSKVAQYMQDPHADWEGDVDDRRQCLATAEYKSIADAAAEVTWVNVVLADLGEGSGMTPTIWCDNSGAIEMSANSVHHAQSKHVDLDVHFVREKVVAKQLQVRYVPTSHQVADGFTKLLARGAFEYFRDQVRLRNGFNCCRVVITTVKWLQQLMLSVSPCSISTLCGLLYVRDSSNLQYVTSSCMVLYVYSKTLMASHIDGIQCGSVHFLASRIKSFVKSQVDYILGNNPMKISYMVGYGSKHPTQLHHRGSSIPSIHSHPQEAFEGAVAALLDETKEEALLQLETNFIWGAASNRPIHWVRWEVVAKHKEFGGLGIVDVNIQNRSLLNKWVGSSMVVTFIGDGGVIRITVVFVKSPCTPPAPRVIPLAIGCPRIARSNDIGRMPSVGCLRMPNVLEPPDHSSPELFNAWTRANNLVNSWILNSVSKDIAASLLYHTTAVEIWRDLVERFQQSNGPRFFQLKKRLHDLVQGQQSGMLLEIGLLILRVKNSQSAHTNSVVANEISQQSSLVINDALTPQQCQQLITMLTSQLQAASSCDTPSSSINATMQDLFLNPWFPSQEAL